MEYCAGLGNLPLVSDDEGECIDKVIRRLRYISGMVIMCKKSAREIRKTNNQQSIYKCCPACLSRAQPATRDVGNLGPPQHAWLYFISPLQLLQTRLTTPLSILTFSSCPTKVTTASNSSSNITLLPVRFFLTCPDICNVIDDGPLAGPPPPQGGYYPQQPQQAYQGYGGQPGYQPQPQPQAVYV